jgi:hypothetical protein
VGLSQPLPNSAKAAKRPPKSPAVPPKRTRTKEVPDFSPERLTVSSSASGAIISVAPDGMPDSMPSCLLP